MRTDRGIGVFEQVRVGGDVAQGTETRPFLGEETSQATVKPVDLRAGGGGDPAKNDLGHSTRMAFGMGDGEGRPPRRAADQPGVDREVCAQALDVGDEVVGRVDPHVSRGIGGRWRAPATTALVEEDDAVAGRVEESTVARRATGARAAMQDTAGLPVGLPQASQ